MATKFSDILALGVAVAKQQFFSLGDHEYSGRPAPWALLWLSPPEPDFASKRSGAQECPAPNGALLSKRSEVASSCWRAAERPLYEKGETKEEEKKKHTNHTQVVALTIHINAHQ